MNLTLPAKAYITVGLLLAAISVSAKESRVFIDVNNSYAEIEIFIKQCKAEGSDYVIIPDQAALGPQLRNLQKQNKMNSKEYDQLNCHGQMVCGNQYTNPKCQGLADKRNKIDDEIKKISADKLNPEVITSQIKNVYDKGGKVKSVMVSGEDGGQVFGAYGNLKYPDLRAALEKVPQLKQDVQSVYLWGCYMGTAGMNEMKWKDMFPSAKLVVGFHDSGPADGSPPSLRLLQKAMATEQKAYSSYGKEGAGKFFKSFPESRVMNTSMCINGQYVDNKQNFSLSEMKEKGDRCIQQFPKDLHEVYKCYDVAEEAKCAQPPSDHNSNKLREYYTYLRNHDYCLDNPVFAEAVPNAGRPDSVLGLVYYDRVWKNFLRIHGEDMKKINTLLKAEGLGAEVAFSGGPNMTRKEFRDWYEKASSALAPRDSETAEYLKSALANIYRGVVGLNPWYIPRSWLTGESTEKGHFSMEVKAKCEN